MKVNMSTAAVAATALVLGAAGGFATASSLLPNVEPIVSMAQPARIAKPTQSVPAPDSRAIVARNTSSVVGITAKGKTKAIEIPEEEPLRWGASDNAAFYRLFRDLPIPRGNLANRSGSGFIISPDGLILTAAHVVRGAKVVTVRLQDRRVLQAKILGSDPVTDVAVLKVDAHRLPTVHLGNSDTLAVGDNVLTIGQPCGLEQSSARGVINAMGRTLPEDSALPFIQTDVVLNPGNSGGPLFDARGDVVGVNTQIYTTTGRYEGLSFAIPINAALDAKDQIVRNGNVEHQRLSSEAQSLASDDAGSWFRL